MNFLDFLINNYGKKIHNPNFLLSRFNLFKKKISGIVKPLIVLTKHIFLIVNYVTLNTHLVEKRMRFIYFL